MTPRVYADFHNLDDENRVRLNTQGTVQDLARLGLRLAEGLALTLYTEDADEAGHPDDLLVDGIARRSDDSGWVAEVDWSSLRHESDEAGTNGQPGQSSAAGKVV